MDKAIEIFNQIKNTSGRLDKEQILRDNENNKEFKYYLKFLLDPFVITGIGKKKLKKFMNMTTRTVTTFENFTEVTEYIQENNTGVDSVVDKVAVFIKLQPEHTRGFYEGIVRKDLKIGITSNTVNKIYGKGYINQFKVQLAKSYEDEMDKIQSREFVLTEKIDGQRMLLFVNDDKIKCFARSGKPIIGLIDIENEAKELPNGVYDGELVVSNAEAYSDREVLQETLKITRKDGKKVGVDFLVFDFITLNEFDDGETLYGYNDRRVLIERIVGSNFKWIKTLPVLYKGKDISIIPKLLKELEEQGKEGLMLNLSDSKWKNKRTSDLLKVKSMKTVDLKIIGFTEGGGKYEGKLGNIILDYKGNELGCGSGFDDQQRVEIWNNKEDYLGKICEIQYFRESKNEQGELSVSFPVFITMREDKIEPSYY